MCDTEGSRPSPSSGDRPAACRISSACRKVSNHSDSRPWPRVARRPGRTGSVPRLVFEAGRQSGRGFSGGVEFVGQSVRPTAAPLTHLAVSHFRCAQPIESERAHVGDLADHMSCDIGCSPPLTATGCPPLIGGEAPEQSRKGPVLLQSGYSGAGPACLPRSRGPRASVTAENDLPF
jgi:hypothetical protein